MKKIKWTYADVFRDFWVDEGKKAFDDYFEKNKKKYVMSKDRR